MSVLKAVFGLVLIVLFVGFGYWMYATYTTKTGDDAIWAGLNGLMPQTLQQWACGEVEMRVGGETAPQSCAAYWDAPGAEEAAAPGAETELATPGADADVDTAPADATGVQ
jgi:hypothetical protein